MYAEVDESLRAFQREAGEAGLVISVPEELAPERVPCNLSDRLFKSERACCTHKFKCHGVKNPL